MADTTIAKLSVSSVAMLFVAVTVIVPVAPTSLAAGVPERTAPVNVSHAGLPETEKVGVGVPVAVMV